MQIYLQFIKGKRTENIIKKKNIKKILIIVSIIT